MRDPGLCAVDPPSAASAAGTRRQAAEVGADVGFGEDSRGKYFTAGDLWQPMGLLLGCAAEQDQFSGNFRAGAKRACADPAARQFFGDDAHDELA